MNITSMEAAKLMIDEAKKAGIHAICAKVCNSSLSFWASTIEGIPRLASWNTRSKISNL